MTSDFESAFRHLLKAVIREVAVELLNEKRIPDRPVPQKPVPAEECFLLNSRQAAKRLAISERHLFTLTHSGILPCVRLGRRVRYSVEAIQKWIRDSESKDPPQPRPTNSVRRRTKAAIKSKPSQQGAPKGGRMGRPAKEPPLTTKEKRTNVTAMSRRDRSKKPESEERLNPFRRLLIELGVSDDHVPSLTNGDLRQIADVDFATFHGWMYLNRELPEEAIQKLRDHFRAFRRKSE